MSQHYSSPTPIAFPDIGSTPRKLPSKALYLSHIISTWNSRGFEFGAVLFLAAIFPGTLMPMSIYALVRAAVMIVSARYIGDYIDSNERLEVVRLSIVSQRLAVAFSCVGFILLLSGVVRPFTFESYAVLAVLVALACVEKMGAAVNLIAVERDWVVVIADEQEDVLQVMNAQMRQIDLFCKLVSPLVIALIDSVSSTSAVLATFIINVVVVGPEYLLIKRVFEHTPALARKSPVASALEGTGWFPVDCETAAAQEIRSQNNLLAMSRQYFSSAAFLPSLALSFLYLTVLSFSGQMTTFLLAVPNPKLTSTAVGLLRTVATIFELSSTFIAPRLMNTLGPVRAGIWCLSWQTMCLGSGVGLLWAYSDNNVTQKVGVLSLIITVILSRVGLWSFDLVAQFHIQNSIDPSQRGSFSSTEAALQNFFELSTFATTIIFSKPEQFKYPAAVSLTATCIAAALYAKFVRDKRGHLLHLSPCFKWTSGSYRPITGQDEVEIESRES